MTDVLVRGVSDQTHREIKRQAKKNGRSVNAEMLAALDKAAEGSRQGLLAELESIKRKFLLEGEEFSFEIERDKTPARFVDFSGPEFDLPEGQ